MKKIIILAVVLWLAPSISLAAWWNPLTWFEEKEVEVSVPTDTGLGQIVAPVAKPLTIPAPEPLEPKVVEKVITKTVTVDNPVQTQKIKELTAQLNEANRTINDLKTQINSLQVQIESLKTQALASQTKKPDSQLTEPMQMIDYSLYPMQNIRDYTKNPLPYFDKPLMMRDGLIVGFSPAVDPTTERSYIHLVGTALDPGEIALRVDDVKDFNKLTQQLKNGDRVVIYGVGARSIGVKSGEFKTSGGESSAFISEYMPVIVLRRISKCGTGCDDIYAPIISK